MSDDQLNLPARAVLLALMSHVTEASNRDLKASVGFEVTREIRERLTRPGFVRVRLGPKRAFLHELTDAGWRRCREELASPTPPKADKGYRLLYAVLNRFDRHMARSGLKIADVFSVEIEDRIRAAYNELADEPGGLVKLIAVRARLGDVSKKDFNAALLNLDLQPGVRLMPESDQKTLSEADWASAVRIGGEEKHLLSIGQR